MKLLKLRILLASASLFGALFLPLAVSPALAAASTSKSDACAGLTALDASQDCSSNAGGSVNNLLAAIVNILSLVVGAVAVIMIIVAGFRFITGGGDTNSVASARRTLIYALIGLIVVALAQFLVHAVLTQASKTG